MNYMDIAEFRAEGYLQELNRQFLHPLGLALVVSIDEKTGEESIKGVRDWRHDLEGIVFDGGFNAKEVALAKNVARLAAERKEPREKAVGSWIQPVMTDALS